MKIRPLADRIVVKIMSAEQTLKSGIVIPDTAKEKPQEGEVVAVGPGRLDTNNGKRIAVELKVGDRVLFENWGGKDYKADGVEYKILSSTFPSSSPTTFQKMVGIHRLPIKSAYGH